MIELKQEGDHYFARQRMESPSVYLDHWALRKISVDERMSARFVAALRSRGGTLVTSLISSGEFAGLQFEAEADAADRLLDALTPHLFFIWLEPFEVIAKEEELAAGVRRPHPAADDDAMQRFVELGPSPLAGKGLFKLMVANGSHIRPQMEDLGRGALIGIERLKHRYDTEPELRTAAHDAPGPTNGVRSTLPLLQVLVRRFLKDRHERLDLNDGIDLLHTVVPAAYCDFVLLDRRWAAAVEEARRELERHGIETPVATVFSERKNGVERFLGRLEAFQPGATRFARKPR